MGVADNQLLRRRWAVAKERVLAAVGRRFAVRAAYRGETQQAEQMLILDGKARLRAWVSLTFADHGFLRPIYWNMDLVTDRVLRGPQPNPFQIRFLAWFHGIRTIVNLRGPNRFGSYALEREMCARKGIKLENCIFWSREPPTRDQIHAFKALIERIEYPALFHCKSGADRAGMASALYLILQEGCSVTEAARQLNGNGHMRTGPTGVLDAFFVQYLKDTAEKPMDFMAWVDTVYDQQALKASFKPARIGSFIVDRILRRE